jgi:2-polyprenyl-3-methyl-5-hydroxy-6-metoxy-1,4-benzoquinol methylase
MEAFFDANRLSWDDRAELHATDTTGSYRIATVLAGGSALHALEASEIGDVTGKDIVHLQCHIGLDTLSLKHLGARSATGLDFSAKAILAAREFAHKAGTEARFVEASVYDAVAVLGETYDMVFVTWGAINWLPDIFAWAKVVAALLRPGGNSICSKAIRRCCNSRPGKAGSTWNSAGARRRTSRSPSTRRRPIPATSGACPHAQL